MAIKINIGTIKDGSQTLDFIAGAKELGLEDGLLKDKVKIFIDLFKAAHQIDLKITLSGMLNLTCDRCLDMFDHLFETTFELVYVQKTTREGYINDGYIKTYNPFMKSIDITDDIREYTLLAIPMKRIPAETNGGICSWCGKTRDYWNKFIVDEDQLKTKIP